MSTFQSTLLVVAAVVLAAPVQAIPMTSLRPMPIHSGTGAAHPAVPPPTSAIHSDLPGPMAPAPTMYQHRRSDKLVAPTTIKRRHYPSKSPHHK